MWSILGGYEAKKKNTKKLYIIEKITLQLITDTAGIVKKQNNQAQKYKKAPCLQLLCSDWLNSISCINSNIMKSRHCSKL